VQFVRANHAPSSPLTVTRPKASVTYRTCNTPNGESCGPGGSEPGCLWVQRQRGTLPPTTTRPWGGTPKSPPYPRHLSKIQRSSAGNTSRATLSISVTKLGLGNSGPSLGDFLFWKRSMCSRWLTPPSVFQVAQPALAVRFSVGDWLDRIRTYMGRRPFKFMSFATRSTLLPSRSCPHPFNPMLIYR